MKLCANCQDSIKCELADQCTHLEVDCRTCEEWISLCETCEVTIEREKEIERELFDLFSRHFNSGRSN